MASTNYSTVLSAILNKTAAYKTTWSTYFSSLTEDEQRITTALLMSPGVAEAGYESLTGARTLTVNDGGKIFGLNLAGGFTVTLPLLSTLPANWTCEFYVETAPTSDYVVIANATDLDKMAGHILSSSGGAEDTETAATGDQVNFISAAGISKVGDWLRLRTNQSAWFARGECSTAAAMTITG